jgi:hypothetical protein
MLNELRHRTGSMLASLQYPFVQLYIEYETISESDAAFMGYQQTNSADVAFQTVRWRLSLTVQRDYRYFYVEADDNENYSSFFEPVFAGAGNVLHMVCGGFPHARFTRNPRFQEISVKDFISRHILDQNLTVMC